jgi:3-oxoacyl-[acyl-carrier protein] reductase
MLQGKTAVITGANRGIGRAVLELFAENGADIIACCRSIDGELEAAMHSIEEQRAISISLQVLDLCSEQSIKEAAKAIVQKKRCDILINCAGIAHGGMFQMTPVADIRKVFEVNYFAQIAFSQQLARFMAKQGGGVIVNVSSIAGLDGTEGNIAYGASKAALILATKTMAAELARNGIRVNAVAPGMIETDMLGQNAAAEIQAFTSRSLMHRCGAPREIAQAILFLASDMSSFMTGQTLRLDGGLL